MFCKECGKEIKNNNAVICTNCGCPIENKINQKDKSSYSNITAFLLCFFIGIFGIHRFYVGKSGSAIAMLILTLTFFGMIISGIWNFVDFIIIICQKFQDKDGKTLYW